MNVDYLCSFITEVLEKDPPYNAHVKFQDNTPSSGWASKELSALLKEAAETASEKFFGKAPQCIIFIYSTIILLLFL